MAGEGLASLNVGDSPRVEGAAHLGDPDGSIVDKRGPVFTAVAVESLDHCFLPCSFRSVESGFVIRFSTGSVVVDSDSLHGGVVAREILVVLEIDTSFQEINTKLSVGIAEGG